MKSLWWREPARRLLLTWNWITWICTLSTGLLGSRYSNSNALGFMCCDWQFWRAVCIYSPVIAPANTDHHVSVVYQHCLAVWARLLISTSKTAACTASSALLIMEKVDRELRAGFPAASICYIALILVIVCVLPSKMQRMLSWQWCGSAFVIRSAVLCCLTKILSSACYRITEQENVSVFHFCL